MADKDLNLRVGDWVDTGLQEFVVLACVPDRDGNIILLLGGAKQKVAWKYARALYRFPNLARIAPPMEMAFEMEIDPT